MKYYASGGGITYNAVGCSVTTAHVVVTCSSTVGVGRGLTFVITVGLQSSAAFTTTYAYAAPVITAIFAQLLQTLGGDAIVVSGSNFGPTGTTVVMAYGAYSATSCQVTTNQILISCVAAPGVGAGYTATVTVASVASLSSTARLSYLPPVLTDAVGTGAVGADTAGGDPVTLAGSQLGPVGTTPVVTYGPVASSGKYTAVACTVSVASVQIQCTTAPGTGAGYAWVVTIGGQSSFAAAYNGTRMSYHAPIIALVSGVGAIWADTAGSQPVSIEGRYFGATTDNSLGPVTYGKNGTEFTASACSLVTPHILISCLSAPGAGDNLVWRVVVGGLTSVLPTTSYGHPVVTGFAGTVTGASTDGGNIVLVLGHNFGPPPGTVGNVTYLTSVMYGPTGAEHTARACMVVTQHEISCVLAAGIGSGLVWIVAVAGLSSAASSASTAYAAPTLNFLSPWHAPTNGGSVVTISGQNLGVSDATVITTVTMNGLPAMVLARGGGGSSLQTIQFSTLVGFGNATIAVSLVAPGVTISIPAYLTFSYDPPAITTLSKQQNSQSAALVNIVVYGSSFCADTGCGSLWIQNADIPNGPFVQIASSNLTWSHSMISAVTNILSGTVKVVVGGISSGTSGYKEFSPLLLPQANQIFFRSALYPTVGGSSITVLGYYFGNGGISSVNVTVGGSPCHVTVAPYQYQPGVPPVQAVACVLPAGQGAADPVVLTRAGLSSFSNSNPFISYTSPQVTGACTWSGSVPCTCSTTGTSVTAYAFTTGSNITLCGSNFGQPGPGSGVSVSGVAHISATEISPRTPSAMFVAIGPGDGMNYGLVVTAGGQVCCCWALLQSDGP